MTRDAAGERPRALVELHRVADRAARRARATIPAMWLCSACSSGVGVEADGDPDERVAVERAADVAARLAERAQQLGRDRRILGRGPRSRRAGATASLVLVEAGELAHGHAGGRRPRRSRRERRPHGSATAPGRVDGHGSSASRIRAMSAASRRGARLDLGDDDVLVVGVRSAADGAEAVEGRHADARGEVAVAGAADRDADERRHARGARRSPAPRSKSAGGCRAPPAADGSGRRRPRELAPAHRTSSARMPASTRSCSAIGPGARRRRRTTRDAGTVLIVVPAASTVGVTVVPASASPSAAIASTWCASSMVALTPRSGSRPGVRGAPGDAHLVARHALACELERAAVGGGLERRAPRGRRRPPPR